MAGRATRLTPGGLAIVASLLAFPASLAARDSELDAFRALYEELVETNTTHASGSCTEAAMKMATRLRDAGFSKDDVRVIVSDAHPREGSLVAVLRAPQGSAAKGVLLLAHLDVVEANREDWTQDPFELVEAEGYFQARGAADDKAMAAIWVDSLIRLHRDPNFRPRRDLRLALTCGEESLDAFNGVQHLVATHRDWIQADFALNEGGYGMLDAQGQRVMFAVQAGEKTPRDFKLEVLHPGGHSARPLPDNAIYRLAAGLVRLGEHAFPIRFNDTTRAYFQRLGAIRGGSVGAAMQALAANPADAQAAAIVSADPTFNAMLRTTCVATMLDAGHATNALPQRARANVNCRIFPGTSIESVQQALVQVLADPAIEVTALPSRMPSVLPPALTSEILRPLEHIAAQHYPGVPILPAQSSGYTDGPLLTAAGIQTFGIGLFLDPDFGHIHGANERIRVRSVYEGRAFLHALVRAYAEQHPAR